MLISSDIMYLIIKTCYVLLRKHIRKVFNFTLKLFNKNIIKINKHTGFNNLVIKTWLRNSFITRVRDF